MREKLGDQLGIDEIARTASFSKFHFSRIFQRITGISPGRFLWAMRIQRAKQLLLTSSLNVTEISHCVGYSSIGTFSTRFSSAVGVSPSVYRRLGGYVPEVPAEDEAEDEQAATEPKPPVVTGEVSGASPDDSGPVFLGLFADRMPQGRPASATLLTQPGPFVLSNVPHGTWYVLAHSIAVPANARAVDAPVLLAPPDVRLAWACGSSGRAAPGGAVRMPGRSRVAEASGVHCVP
ncbi:MAG TPA: helix-turn-helix transcriptional regulator [Pilimelia sp.]|nr:helix-turn-helix transcriptional regulator [Pilimelia sp.]